MRIAIIATGDEVVQGDVLNTNTKELAQALHSEGFAPDIHLACLDSENELEKCLQWICPDHDMMIFIGGLGPTSDDKTRFAIANFTKEPLVEHEEAIKHIESRLKKAGLTMHAGSRQQALFPENTNLYPNPYGTAYGGCFSWNERKLIMLPGPPKECIPMFNHYVLPMLREMQPSDTQLLRWRVFGIAESKLGEMMDNAVKHLDCQTGYRWDPPYIEFKIRCPSSSIEAVKSVVSPLLTPYIIASAEQKASERLKDLIESRKESIGIQDMATGGVLQTIIQNPTNRKWVNFDISEQKNAWHVELYGLDAYWAGKKDTQASLNIRISYHNTLMFEEVHFLPYFSSTILGYAAEWVSYRLVECIEKHD